MELIGVSPFPPPGTCLGDCAQQVLTFPSLVLRAEVFCVFISLWNPTVPNPLIMTGSHLSELQSPRTIKPE